MVLRLDKTLEGRQSLVTPIDYKNVLSAAPSRVIVSGGRQSLVTPIDWKPLGVAGTDRRKTPVANLC